MKSARRGSSRTLCVLLSALGVAAVSQSSAQSFGPGDGGTQAVIASCMDVVPCVGACTGTYVCVPRPVSTHIYQVVTGTRGDWEASGISCGKCIKTVLGVPIPGADCGGSGVDVCWIMQAAQAAENDKRAPEAELR